MVHRCVLACATAALLASGRRVSLRAASLTAGKRRREKFDFLGGSVVQKQLAEGATKRRIGLIIPTGAPARQHSKILDAAGKEVGEVTSGGFSPCLQKNIAMGACCRSCATRVRSPCPSLRTRVCGDAAVQGGHVGEGGCARQGERGGGDQDAVHPDALLQGVESKLFAVDTNACVKSPSFVSALCSALRCCPSLSTVGPCARTTTCALPRPAAHSR